MSGGLQVAIDVYERNRHDWSRDYRLQFVLIHDREVAGFYPDYSSAFREGLKRFGVTSEFLVKQISEEEPVFVIY